MLMITSKKIKSKSSFFKLQLSLNNNIATLSLLKGNEIINTVEKKYERDLSSVLISCLDKLLEKTSIDVSYLDSYFVSSDLGSDNTSLKIATAFLEGVVVRHI